MSYGQSDASASTSYGDLTSYATRSRSDTSEVIMGVSDDTRGRLERMQSRLNQKLGPGYISYRPGPGGGAKLTYIEGWRVVSLANEVFGFNGWSSSIVKLTVDFCEVDPESRRCNVGVSAIVRVTLRDGTFHEDIGYGEVTNGKGRGPSLDKCKKEAVTDGVKRALKNFGNLLGGCLYDKSYTQEIAKMKPAPQKFDHSTLYHGIHNTQPPPPQVPQAITAVPYQSPPASDSHTDRGTTSLKPRRASASTPTPGHATPPREALLAHTLTNRVPLVTPVPRTRSLEEKELSRKSRQEAIAKALHQEQSGPSEKSNYGEKQSYAVPPEPGNDSFAAAWGGSDFEAICAEMDLGEHTDESLEHTEPSASNEAEQNSNLLSVRFHPDSLMRPERSIQHQPRQASGGFHFPNGVPTSISGIQRSENNSGLKRDFRHLQNPKAQPMKGMGLTRVQQPQLKREPFQPLPQDPREIAKRQRI